jgi:hypothetical protein
MVKLGQRQIGAAAIGKSENVRELQVRHLKDPPINQRI